MAGGGRLQLRNSCKRRDPGSTVLGHDRKALSDKGPVQPLQRRYVGNRCEGHKIEEPEKVRTILTLGAHQSVDANEHQEDNRRSADMPEAAVIVMTVRVHHRDTIREGFACQMVIQYDHVTLSRSNWIVAQCPAVHANDQVVLVAKTFHGGRVRTVAFLEAVRNVERRTDPEVS